MSIKSYEVHVHALIQGQTDPVLFDLICDEFTRIGAGPTREALRLHLVKGYAAPMAYGATGITQPNFSRALKTLNQKYALLETYRDLQNPNDQKVTP